MPCLETPANAWEARPLPSTEHALAALERPFAAYLADMHCHLDRMENAEEIAGAARDAGIAVLDAPVTPRDAQRARELLAPFENVRVAIGLHPWWIADGSCGEADAGLAAELAADARFTGEVGLDFSRRCLGSRDAQIACFSGIVRSIARNPLPGRVMTVHAVRSVTAVLDIMEREGVLGTGRGGVPSDGGGILPCVVLHWFSGTSDELARARRLGCYFSVSEHMLASKRGREYARVVPEERLLLETDAPPGLDAPYSAGELRASLEAALSRIAEIRGVEREALRDRVTRTSAHLLGMDGAGA